MHATLEELLTLRDRDTVPAEVAAHVAQCEACRAELERLEALRDALQRLPEAAPPDVLPHVMARLAGPQVRRWPALASAAAVLLVLSSAFLLATHHTPLAPQAGVDALVARSQHLEALLNALPPRPPVEQAATSATIDALQSRIEMLDAQLSRAAGGEDQPQLVQRLWTDRVQLLNSLVYVRYAEAAGDAHGQARPYQLGVI